MKKKILTWLSAVLCLTLSISAPALASDTTESGTDTTYYARFTNADEMVDNFSDDDTVMDVIFSGLQPGDVRTFEVTITNQNDNDTDWYLENTVLQTLEEATDAAEKSGTAGYTYKLTYNNTTLFNSEVVGGEDDDDAGVGLHGATDAFEMDQEEDNWLFLDTLSKGQSSKISLTVGLDGETQGNSYQQTLAQLAIRFAVEKKETEPKEIHKRRYVKTGDETNMMPLFAVAAISGLGLLALGIYGKKLRREQEKGVSGR